MIGRYQIHDTQAHIAREMRRKNTWLNPRYLLVDTQTGQTVDESTRKRALQITQRAMNAGAQA